VAVSLNDVETAHWNLLQEIEIRIHYPQNPTEAIRVKNAYDLADFRLAVSHDEFTLLYVEEPFIKQSVISALNNNEGPSVL
jgi:hypothetical protein